MYITSPRSIRTCIDTWRCQRRTDGGRVDVNFSEKSIAMQISEAIQVIVQIKRFPDGSRKISQISCVEGLDENDKVKVVDIFRYDKNKKGFIATGYVPRSIIEKIRSQNIPFQESIFEVKRGEENA